MNCQRHMKNNIFILKYSSEKISASPLFEPTNTTASLTPYQPFFSETEQEIVHKTCQVLEIGHTKEIVLAQGRKEECFCTISRISEETAIASLIYTLDMKVQESKKKAYQLLVKLTGIVRHDILNQLTAIMGYFEIMADMVPEELDPFLKKEFELVQNVRNLTEATRYYQDLGKRPATWLSMHDLISQYQQITLFKGLTISGTVADIEIFVDPEFDLSLSRVFQDLMKAHPCVEINCGWEIRKKSKDDEESNQRVLNDEEYLCIWFSDNVGYFKECKSRRVFHHTSASSGSISFYILAEVCSMTDIIPEIQIDPICRFELLVPPSSYLIYNNR